MTSNIIALPTNRSPKPRQEKPAPDSVRLHSDFGSWCVEFFRGDKFVYRELCASEAAANVELDRLVGEGLRRLEPGPYLRGEYEAEQSGEEA